MKSPGPGSWRRRKKARDSFNPDSKMDVLKSEILRKRQLVEDRNLLVVRSLEVVGVGDGGAECLRRGGPGERGTVPRGSLLGGAQPGPRRGPREPAARPAVPLALTREPLGWKCGNCRKTRDFGSSLSPSCPSHPFPSVGSFRTAPVLLVLHFCRFSKALHFMCTSCFVAQDIKKMWLRTTT